MARQPRREHVRLRLLGRLAPPFGTDYVAVEATAAIVLVAAVIAALLWSNSPFSDTYTEVWGRELTIGRGDLSMTHTWAEWISNGLMAIFFFVVGLELKRELAYGELRHPRAAAVPLCAAVGGVVAPALIYVALNAGTPEVEAWAIPTATDTALAIGLLALIGARVAPNAKLLLVSIAIVDDLIAVLVIAFVYSGGIEARWLALGGLIVLLMLLVRIVGVANPLVFVPFAVALWIAIEESGIHATIAGVVLGLLTPARTSADRALLERLERDIHPWAAFVVVPLFALSSMGVSLSAGDLQDALGAVGLGVALGLVVGKFVGILSVGGLVVRSGVGRLPPGVTLADVVGVATIAGVGFSVSLFVAELTLAGAPLAAAKIGLLTGSMVSGALGLVVFTWTARRHPRRR
jgi:NhaA family Na+:H+ antiporter